MSDQRWPWLPVTMGCAADLRMEERCRHADRIEQAVADLIPTELVSHAPWTNVIFRVHRKTDSVAEDRLAGELVCAGAWRDLLCLRCECTASPAARLVETRLVRLHCVFHRGPADPTDCVDPLVIASLPRVVS